MQAWDGWIPPVTTSVASKALSIKDHAGRVVLLQETTMATVRIFPRRKAGENASACPEKGREPLKFDVNSIQPLFALTQKDAARALGISVTALKKVCRKLGIHSWLQGKGKGARLDICAAKAKAPASTEDLEPQAQAEARGRASAVLAGKTPAMGALWQQAQEAEVSRLQAELDDSRMRSGADALENTEQLSAQAQSKKLSSRAGFIGALDFRRTREYAPIPDGFDSDLLRDEPPSEDSDSDAQALLQSDVIAEEDAGKERSHCTRAHDLGFLVSLPAGPCLNSSGPEPYSPAWLEWYETSVQEFRGGVM